MAAPVITGVVPGTDSLRINFSKTMYQGGNYVDPATYTFSVAAGGVNVATIGVTPGSNYVILHVEGFTDGATYTVYIPGNTIRSTVIEYYDWLVAASETFVAVSNDPQIVGLEMLSATTARVTFSKPMSKNADIETAANYVWSGGLVTLEAEYETEYTVLLTTTTQTPGVAYDLTV